MTLIVGVRCTDGVVIAADSAATFGFLGQHTIKQPYTKVEIIDDTILLGVSGPVGLAQRFAGELQAAWQNQALRGQEHWQAMTTLRQKFLPHIEVEFKAAQASMPVIGNAALESALSQTLVALPVKHEPHLFQFDHQGAPEAATRSLPFVCIGSGRAVADPFLAFLKQVFWQADTLPTSAQAVFATLWTVRQSIEVAPGGLAEPVHVYTLSPDGPGWKAREIEETDLQEHFQAMEEAKGALRDFRARVQNASEDVPPPPSAPPESA